MAIKTEREIIYRIDYYDKDNRFCDPDMDWEYAQVYIKYSYVCLKFERDQEYNLRTACSLFQQAAAKGYDQAISDIKNVLQV